MVYVDSLMTSLKSKNWKWNQSCHMFVDKGTDIEVLHKFAAKIGMKRSWFQVSSSGVPHYDLNKRKRATAIASGAVELDRAKSVEIFRKYKVK